MHSGNSMLAMRRPQSELLSKREDVMRVLTSDFARIRKMGRLVKYDNDSMPSRVFEMFSNQNIIFTKRLVAAHLGIAESTFYEWIHTYPDLSEAVAQGMAVQECLLINLMIHTQYYQGIYTLLKVLHGWSDKGQRSN